MMNELISEYGTPTWLIGRDNGGVIIQQGRSHIMLSTPEINKLLRLLTQQVEAAPKPPILRYAGKQQ